MLMMAAMFVAFILQVVFRYVMNLPVAWTDEVCTLVWLWGILWGASFVMRNRDDIRFDMVYSHLPRPRAAGVHAAGQRRRSCCCCSARCRPRGPTSPS